MQTSYTSTDKPNSFILKCLNYLGDHACPSACGFMYLNLNQQSEDELLLDACFVYLLVAICMFTVNANPLEASFHGIHQLSTGAAKIAYKVAKTIIIAIKCTGVAILVIQKLLSLHFSPKWPGV